MFSVNGEAWQFRVTDEEAMTIASGGGAGSARKMRRRLFQQATSARRCRASSST